MPSDSWRRKKTSWAITSSGRRKGIPVGCGLVERAVALVINARMKKRGMRWKRANATALVALRVQRINADWEAAAA